MTKREMVAEIFENLRVNKHWDIERRINEAAQKNRKERVEEFYNYFLNTPRKIEDSIFCYQLMIM